jgi:hypothetical protein
MAAMESRVDLIRRKVVVWRVACADVASIALKKEMRQRSRGKDSADLLQQTFRRETFDFGSRDFTGIPPETELPTAYLD